MDTLISDIKGVLRTTTNNEMITNEISDLVKTALRDLETCGVKNLKVTDPLIKRAVTVYCKANFGYDNADSEKLMDSYEKLKYKLVLSGDYNGELV